MPEVEIETPAFTVRVKCNSSTLEECRKAAEEVFVRHSPPVPERGPVGFALVERRETPTAQPSSMPIAPPDIPTAW